MIKKIGPLASIALLLTLGSPLYASGVKEIQDDPEHYVGKRVIVSARVESLIKVPFTDYALFVLADDERRMPLFAPAGTAGKGEKVRIRVKVLGIKRSSALRGGKEAAQELAGFLREKEVADADTADRIAAAVVSLMDGLGSVGAGSYLLVADSW